LCTAIQFHALNLHPQHTITLSPLITFNLESGLEPNFGGSVGSNAGVFARVGGGEAGYVEEAGIRVQGPGGHPGE
jgi:hypothetical protein